MTQYLEILEPAIRRAGNITLQHFGHLVEIESKDDATPVTLVDHESEAILIQAIRAVFPTHSILGEESGKIQGSDEFLWVVDGLDGTRNYAAGIPFFAVTAALFHRDNLVSGAIYAPTVNRLYYAERGKGAWLDAERLYVSEKSPSKMRIAFTRGKRPASFRKQVELMQRFCALIGGSRSFGSVAWELALTARGAIGGVVAVDLEPWDYAAGALLVEEAGGVATNLEGQCWTLQDRDLIAAPPHIHREFLKSLAQ